MPSNPIRLANSNKRRAQRFRKEGNYPQAIDLMQSGIAALEEAIRTVSTNKEKDSQYERELAGELADMYGSLGGIYRTAKQFQKAYRSYDAGWRYEQNPKYRLVNSYNLTQRLVLRLLHDPTKASAEKWQLDRVSYPDDFQRAVVTVQEQISGPRAKDPWALADLAVLQLLLGSREREQATWSKLENAKPKPAPYVFSSTAQALSDLQKQIEETLADFDSPRLNELNDNLLQAIERNKKQISESS